MIFITHSGYRERHGRHSLEFAHPYVIFFFFFFFGAWPQGGEAVLNVGGAALPHLNLFLYYPYAPLAFLPENQPP